MRWSATLGASMGAGLVLLLVSVAAALVVAGRLLNYPARPSEWRFAFGSEHRSERQALHQAYRRRRALTRNDRQAVAALKRRVKDTKKAGRRRRRALEKERDQLLYPGRGDLVDELGPLQLYRHALLFLTDDSEDADEDEEVPLAGLHATFDSTSDETFIEVTRQDGTTRLAGFGRYRYPSGDVKAFQVLINNEALADRDFRDRQRGRAVEVEAQIKQAIADAVAGEEAARRDVEELIEAQRTNPQRTQVEQEWEEQCRAWQELTGRRPIWWWRW